MPFNGAGTFVRIYNWVEDKANSIPITASRMDGEFDGIGTALSSCITKDGQTTLTANIPFANYKLTGLGNGTARTDAINVGQAQDNQFLYLGTTSGSADAYTLAPSPTITAYATTQQFTAKINATNLTTTPYLQISAIANPTTTAVIKKLSATKTEIAVEASDLLANGIYKFQRNSANDSWIVLNPEKPYINLTNGTTATTSTRGITFLNNPITIANNATTPNTDIDFNGGNFQLNDGSGQAVVTAMTKRLQSSGSWSAGNNGNLLTTGARANSSTYHLYSITNPATGASDYMALLGVAGTAPDPTSVLPSGYTKFDLIASVETDASGNIRTGTYTFFRGGYKFKLNGNGVQTYSGTSIATPTLRAILAPRGLSVELDFVVAHFLTSGSGTMGSLYSNEGKTASSTNSQIQGFYTGSAFNYGGSPPNVFSNTSSQVYESLYFGSTTTNTTYITCYGWTFYKK